VSQLRTPLNAIIGMTGLLLESQLTDTQREWLELLEISGNTLLTLVGTHHSIESSRNGMYRIYGRDIRAYLKFLLRL
jgi:signal transduction histidine kinase